MRNLILDVYVIFQNVEVWKSAENSRNFQTIKGSASNAKRKKDSKKNKKHLKMEGEEAAGVVFKVAKILCD